MCGLLAQGSGHVRTPLPGGALTEGPSKSVILAPRSPGITALRGGIDWQGVGGGHLRLSGCLVGVTAKGKWGQPQGHVRKGSPWAASCL